MKRLILFISFISLTIALFAQSVGINATGNDPDPSAMLDVQDTTKGFLVPRLTTAQRDAIPSPATGLLIYNTDNAAFNFYSGTQWIEEADRSSTNEIQSLSFASDNLSISTGNSVSLASLRDNLGNHTATQALRLSDQPIYLRPGTDLNHGLGWNGGPLQFNSFTPDGPILFGFSGGILGTTNGGDKAVLSWRNSGQVGIDNPSPAASAALDIQSTQRGLLIPRMTSGQRTSISNPANGLLVYDLTSSSIWVYNGSTWQDLGNETILVDQDGDTQIQVEESPDEDVIRMDVQGQEKLVVQSDRTLITNDFRAGRVGNQAVPSQAVSTGPLSGFNANPSNLATWQSFIPTVTGTLNYIQVLIGNTPLSSYTFSIYAGEGTAGTPLLTTTLNSPISGLNTVLFSSNVTLTAGQTYTVSFSSQYNLAFFLNGTYADGRAGVNANSDFFLRVFLDEPLYALNVVNGNLGIGVPNPTRGKVEISGGLSVDLGSIGYLPQSGITGNANPGSYLYSLYADQRIAALEVFAHSDRRIKDISGISDGETDLSTLMQIEVTDYSLRDSIQHGQRLIKKVIAQQVVEVYPQAVTNNLTEVVPDIYQRAEVQDGWIMLATDLQPGERVKLITQEKSEVYEVLAVEAGRFSITKPGLSGKQVFVYGREVKDFHTVDYEAISMLNVSATQEQQRIIEEQQKRIEELEQRLNQMDNLAVRLKALEAALSTPVHEQAAASPRK